MPIKIHLLCKAGLLIAQIVQVHAVRLGTRLVFHKVAAILGRAQTGLDQTPIDHDVVDTLDRPQRIVVMHVRHIGGRRRTLGA